MGGIAFMAKIVSIDEAVAQIKDGMSIMVGGFLSAGGANEVLHAIAEKGIKDLTVYCNDGGLPSKEHSLAELIHNGQVSHLVATHIGMNPEVGQKMNDGSMKVTLVPQGTLAEKIRAGGYGLGGVLTPTGLGTPVGVGSEDVGGGTKTSVTIDGKEYLFERPVRADIALIYGSVADKYGNVKIHGDARNFNIVMAAAADTVICQADEVIDMMDPDEVLIQNVLVDYIVDMGGNK
jgi:acetate CoA/acetoacetate CoA-transferase alpha subunit